MAMDNLPDATPKPSTYVYQVNLMTSTRLGQVKKQNFAGYMALRPGE